MTVSLDEPLPRGPGAGRFCYSGARLYDENEDVLGSLPNVITTLKLCTMVVQDRLSSTQYYHREVAGAFHHLCDSPHLLHLPVVRFSLIYDDFDLHDRVRYYDQDSTVYIQFTDTQVLPHPECETFWIELPIHRRVW
ncbi:hypothetical protein BG015_004957 [Linnemannia schmuckeri]|uniref:Uncharacterized protein n=1 Tax=Linnemannia schmuckeri TaxID=64567 RepID=A0A9P5S6P2_9FUNG|nr:hypothetical protein BG015_004957 [Linnemannia schmuckeri]